MQVNLLSVVPKVSQPKKIVMASSPDLPHKLPLRLISRQDEDSDYSGWRGLDRDEWHLRS